MSVKKRITKQLIEVMVDTNSITDHMFKKILTDEEIKEAYDEVMNSKEKKIQNQTQNKMKNYITKMLQKNIKSLTSMSDIEKLQIENYSKGYLSEDIKKSCSLQDMANFLENFIKFKYRATSKKDREFMGKTLDKNLNNVDNYKAMIESLNSENEVSPEVIKMFDDVFFNMEKSYDVGFGFDFQTDAIKALLDEIGRSNPRLILNNNTMQWFTEMYTERIYPSEFAKNKIGNIDKSFEVIKKYIDLTTQLDKDALINNDAISHIVRMAELGKLPEKQIEEINEVLNKNLGRANIEIPNMEKYEKIVENKDKMSEEDFKSFISDVCKIRLCNGAIPERFCDYIISQKLVPHSMMNKEKMLYFPIFKRAIEDKSVYELQRNGITDVNVKVISSELELDKNMKDYAGAQTNVINNIKLRSDGVYNFSKRNTYATNTMFHEIEHAIQHKKIDENESVGKYEYLMIKENIIREHYTQFYDDNYFKVQSEIDARIQGAIKSAEYLKTLGMTDKEIIISDLDTNIKKIKMQINLREKVKDKKIEGKNQSIDEVFQSIIKQYPMLVNAYPILQLEFDSFGNRKSYMEIIKEHEENVKNSNSESTKPSSKEVDNNLIFKSSKASVYLEILKNDSKISNSDIVSDIEALNKVEVNSEIGKAYRAIVIREKLLPKFNEWKKIKKIDYVSEFDPALNITKCEGEEKDFEKVKANLYYFAKENPDLIESKLIKNALKGLVIDKDYIDEIEKSKEEKNITFSGIEPLVENNVENVAKAGNAENKEIQQLQNIDNMVNSEERNEGFANIKLIKSRDEKEANVLKEEMFEK